jgi:hypothetical protein
MSTLHDDSFWDGPVQEPLLPKTGKRTRGKPNTRSERVETRGRARALQALYAADLRDQTQLPQFVGAPAPLHFFQGDHAHHLVAVGQRHAGQCRHALHQRIGLVRALHLPHAWLGRIDQGLALISGLFHRALQRTADGREAVKLLHMADGRQAHIGRVHPA